ncbi:glutamine synthetase/guanido kinase [Leucosporidium creatinivorum]|uniref:Glutamine synthetase/guanido kinase n=1 Tax=Leucosporidium creatinivorum TaxID=106004 RepID=A0A1Y2F7N3_9BASI|nr:glutamine synthetase/guanido kinase [Leucosporidium creatinivorum]
MAPTTPPAAPTNLDELQVLLANDSKVQVAGVDIDGILRGKIMTKDKFLSAVKGQGFGFCSVTFGWDMHDAAYSKELKISNLGNGYRDITARIDLNTYRRTFTTPSLPFFLLTFIEADNGETLSACPRGTLQRVIKDLTDEGLEAYAGAEYEYFQFKETPDSVAAKKYRDLQPLTSGAHGYSLLRPELNSEYFHALYDNAASFGIPIEGHHTETGPGVYESALAYQPVLRMADNAELFKWVAKTTGYQFGVMPTFMAKPYADQPGCSGHVHISLRDKSGENVFAVKESEVENGREGAAAEDTKRISEIAEWFLAGVLKGLPDIMPCLVPTVNGYKRLVESYWAPVNVSYAYENRVASVRIISPPLADRAATRLEVRVPGADMNPYLTFSAVIACGLYGIKNKLPLTQPPLRTKGDNLPKLQRLPKTLQEATARMGHEASLARKVLGDDFVDHYVGTREHEWELFAAAVTDWEVQRYLELA